MPAKRTIISSTGELEAPRPTLRRGPVQVRKTPVIRALNGATLPDADEAAMAELVRAPHDAPRTGEPDHGVYFVKDMRGLVRIDPVDIMYLQADGNYVELHLHQRRIVLRNSLAEVLKMLPHDLMCQVNRAQAVNIRHLDLIGADEVRIGELAFTLSKHFRDPLLGSVRIITGR